MKKEILTKLREKKREMKNLGVIRIGLFGSMLKNKEKRNSDIDLIIKFKKLSFDNYTEVLLLLEKLFKRKIDLITESSLRPEMKYIKKEAEYVRV
jgi:predicted nucleotidyltransferase